MLLPIDTVRACRIESVNPQSVCLGVYARLISDRTMGHAD